MDIKQFAVCDPNIFNFKCTQDLAPLKEFIGQDGAIRGIEFGLNMGNKGHNIYGRKAQEFFRDGTERRGKKEIEIVSQGRIAPALRYKVQFSADIIWTW